MEGVAGMSIMDKNVEIILTDWADKVVPDGMTAPEIRKFAEKAGLNWETLRNLRRRKSYKADTIIRGLLASGVELKSLLNLPVNPKNTLLPNEKEWIQFGRTLSEKERLEFIDLISHVKKIMKDRYKKD